MRIPGIRIFRRHQRHEKASPFANVLPRVRELRESCSYSAATPPLAIEQRQGHVADARTRVSYQPAPRDMSAPPTSETMPLLSARMLLVIVFGVVSVMALILLVASQRGSQVVYTFPQTNSPPFLTEFVAMENAQLALMQLGDRECVWRLHDNSVRGQSVAPDGREDIYFQRTSRTNANSGWFIFEDPKSDIILTITVQLNGNEVKCTVVKTW